MTRHAERDRPPEDLTARARIRDAALAEFATHGYHATTMRGIAAAAGVSTGLVQHHFTSKEALRAACDDAVIDAFRRRLTAAAESGDLGDADFLASLYETSPPLLRYLARTMVDQTPAASYVFDQLTAGAEDFLTTTFPDRFPAGTQQATVAAAVMAAMHSGPITLHQHLDRRLGQDPLGDGHSTVARAILDLYGAMGSFVASEVGTRIRSSVAEQRDHEGRTTQPGSRR